MAPRLDNCVDCAVALTPENRRKARNVCEDCFREETRRWRALYSEIPAGEVLTVKRRSYLLWRYGMSEKSYVAMLEAQGGGCAICGRVLEPGREKYSMAVDHDHACCPVDYSTKDRRGACGRCVRGILCGPCNRGIGQLQDDPALIEKAAAYLRAYELRKL